MKLLILFQVLITIVKVIKAEDEAYTTIYPNSVQTETAADEEGDDEEQNLSGSQTNEFFDSLRESENDSSNDLDFEYDDDDAEDILRPDLVKDSGSKEQEMQEVLLKAMRKPAIRKQIGEVIPILRVMSPAQRLTLAALVSSQIMSQKALSETNVTEMAAMFAGKNVENADDRHNITEHLLLPISMDIAKMFKGLRKEVGRNLRQNFHQGHPSNVPIDVKYRRLIRKPSYKRTPPNRRMDSVDYEETNPSALKSGSPQPKQPGRDECDYFTNSLCLEVSNYPTEAIISSLKKNQDIAKTFLTDFEIQPNDESERGGGGGSSSSSARRLERRQDGQNEVQDFAPEGGYMCPSSVKYARPKRARTTSGQWKYVVNAGDYTQTLRLEICLKPKSPCSYVTNHLNSQCAQVFNYHRLLTWDETKGLHMDIFKVPSCCSCHIQGYSNFYPPNNDFTYAEKRREPLDTSEFAPEQTERQPYNNVGSKREIPKPIPPGPSSVLGIKQSSKHPVEVKEFVRNPVDHLVPPGPPLPLENEGSFNQQSEPPKYYQKKGGGGGGIDHNRRYPVESSRSPPSKDPERPDLNDFAGNFNLGGITRLKTAVAASSSQQRPNLKHSPPPHHPAVSLTSPPSPPPPPLPPPPGEMNPIFESGNPIRYVKPPHPGPEIVKVKPNGSGLFVTAKRDNELVIQPVTKTSSKAASSHPYFDPDGGDVETLASKINPFFITPPKMDELEIRASTTPIPPKKTEYLTNSGQRKINYNYHPIIDFFVAGPKKRHASLGNSQYLQTASQDWTPVLGH